MYKMNFRYHKPERDSKGRGYYTCKKLNVRMRKVIKKIGVFFTSPLLTVMPKISKAP